MKKKDVFLLLVILLTATVLSLCFFLFQSKGNHVIVEVNGEIVKILPLSQDTEYWIQTEEGTNLLIIQNGIARITEADCPDLVCMYMGILSPTNVLTCSPHGVIIYLEDL